MGNKGKKRNRRVEAVKLVKMGQGQRNQGTPSAGFPTGSPAHHIGPFRLGGRQKRGGAGILRECSEKEFEYQIF